MDSIRIRPAAAADLPAVAAVYDEIHAAEEAGTLTTGWLRGVYPTAATAAAALHRGELYVLEAEGAVRGAAVINQTQVDVYAGAPWTRDAPDEAVCVLHTLVIAPSAGRRGLGRRFVAFYEDFARGLGCTELRIDTNARNTAARSMYAALGYREIAVVPTVFNGIPDVQLVLLEKHLD
jgi:GNAT superfamily N-acetyltransferase